MAKEIKQTAEAQIRSLKAGHGYLSVGDIIRLTGHPPDLVREALRVDEGDGASK